jgi:hypothetical protein
MIMGALRITEHDLGVELQRVMQDVFLSLLEGEPEPVATAPRGAAAPRLACRVAIHGPFEGHVTVIATLGVATVFARKMFGSDLPGAPTAGDAQEALREVANIVAGNLKPLFGRHNTLGLPEDLPADAQRCDGSQLAEATGEHRCGTLEVRVYEAAL